MSTIQVDRIIPFQSSSVTIDGDIIQANAATTGSNTFVGNQIINGDLTASLQEGYAWVGGASNVTNAVPTSSFGGGETIVGYATTGSNIFVDKQTISANGIEITGSVNLTPASVSTNANYIVPFISGSTISKDSVDTLFYNPLQNNLIVSASTGRSSLSTIGVGVSSGSGATTNSSNVGITSISTTAGSGRAIILAGNPSLLGVPSLTSNTNPGILATSGSGASYVAIELQASQSFTDGRVTIKRPLIAEEGSEITGSLSVSTDITADKLVLTGGTGLDLIITGSGKITTALTVGPTVGDAASVSGLGISIINSQTADELGFTNNGSEYGVSGWNGPSIYGNDPSDLYPALIGFQNKTDWTAGTITVLKPLDVSGSVSITETMKLASLDPLPAGALGELAVSASNLWFHNGSGWQSINY